MDNRINALKTSSHKVIHQVAEATGEFLGNKIAEKIVEPKNVEEIIIQREKRDEILNKLRQVL